MIGLVLSFLGVTYLMMYANSTVMELMDLVNTLPQSFRLLLWGGGIVNLMIMVIAERVVTNQLLKQENM
jgi:hypothetical protein